MIETILAIAFGLALLAGLAKHRRRKRRPLNVLSTDNVMSLGALAADTGILAPLTSGSVNLGENYWCTSIDLWLTVRGASVGEGPVSIYVCHSDYSLAEIEEYIEGTTQFSPLDLVGREIARRKIRLVTTIAQTAVNIEVNEGRPYRVPIRWMCHGGTTGIVLCAYNTDTTQLTAYIISTQSKWYGHWVF